MTSQAPSNAHLSDPSLPPFLGSTFSVSSYLNGVLPPLQPPTTLSTHRPASAVPLSTLSSQTTTLLSTLDYQTQRLLTTLTALTDEILRLAPRLAYSIDLLRSDVASLGEELQGHATTVVEGAGQKPGGLERLKMLATVRERVEEVVRVFGEAMDWRIDGDGAEEGGEAGKKRGSGGKDLAGEVVFLLASGDLEAAREKVQALRVLAGVFEGTVEGPARTAVVEALEQRVRVEMEKRVEKATPMPVEKKAEEKKETTTEGGYYGLIEQLKGLRGMT
ncbi:hypothetical protein BZA05DRAFT_19881 [Tricharina praecox]|uniref:uncharacterized protein n=1 Tax=Tricharina praecox TaxID=43433 RepID=UPI0022210733|nr:uncharacterized protein BZA05DRAFT_19881 [Tricharina praecox]KAI5859016.1 hypothetical protein BZA05DRAFT_19881 [Tricharina praecox]